MLLLRADIMILNTVKSHETIGGTVSGAVDASSLVKIQRDFGSLAPSPLDKCGFIWFAEDCVGNPLI